jgi:predicted regulator of Ras-like GTPase activity (Roadblock/LC7/MglB family)
MSQAGHLDWLLNDLQERVMHIHQAVILSSDGLVIGACAEMAGEDAEYLAAVAAGFQSLARGAGQHFGVGEVRQTVVELAAAFLFITSAGSGTCLAVLAGSDADAGLVAYEMAILIRRVGEHLGVNPRPASSPAEAV